MKRAKFLVHRPSVLFVGTLAIAWLPPVTAALLIPGQTATVGPGSPVESWTVGGATLNVTPGGATQNITAQNSATLTMDGANVQSGASIATSLTDSTATISGSTLTSSGNYGLNLITNAAGPLFIGSKATVTNSSITGTGRGANVTFHSVLNLLGSQLTGNGTGTGGPTAGGLGMTVVGGTATLTNSSVTGANGGVVMTSDLPAGSNLPTLILNGSAVTGNNGTAVLVLGATAAPNAAINVLNGSTLTGGNGVILDVTGNSTAEFAVDNSTLTGNVQNESTARLDATLTNNAAITGNITNINSLSLDNSALTGNVTVPAGSAATVAMTNNSRLTGSLTNVASLTMNSSTLTGSVVESSGSQASVTLAGGSSLTGSLSNIGSLSMDNSRVTGDVVQDAATPAALKLSNNSLLTGTVTQAQSMSLDGSSRWNMINDSSVGSLDINGGTVNLRGANAGFRTLTLGSLTGSGTFALGTDLAGHLSDLLNVTGNASGNHTLSVQNTGVDPVQENHAQQVVHTGSGDAAFAVPGGQVDVGTFIYHLEKRGTDWYLVQTTTDNGGGDEDEGGGGDDGGSDGGEPVITPSTRAVIGVFSAAPTVWYGETSTLRSRMGELRDGHDQGGGWVRAYGNKYRVSADDRVDYTQNQQGISFGVDTPIPSNSGQWLIGVMGGYSNSDLNMRLGTSGQVNSYYAGIYSTWLADNGYYVDALIKANRFNNKADVLMSDGVKAKGDYHNYGVGGSVEAGRHIKFADDWFIEPYAQLSSLWIQGEHYGLDNGLEARSNHADSFLGKIGTHVGRTIALDKGGFLQPYIKLAAVHEFAQNNKVKVNSTTFSDDLSGSRGELGAGMALQLTDTLQLHADLDYSNGKNIEQPWGTNVGLRYTW